MAGVDKVNSIDTVPAHHQVHQLNENEPVPKLSGLKLAVAATVAEGKGGCATAAGRGEEGFGGDGRQDI